MLLVKSVTAATGPAMAEAVTSRASRRFLSLGWLRWSAGFLS